MQNLLIPTDFSLQAGYAVDAAKKVAALTGGRLFLFHCATNLPQDWENWSEGEKEKFPEHKKNIQQLDEEMTRLKKDCESSGIICDTMIVTGQLLDEIENRIQEEKIDLIVMGSHGRGGRQDIFIGSNTQKVIRKIHCNILIIKEPLEKIHFKKILFASSLGMSDQEAFADFLSLIRIFRPEEIHLLTIDTPGFFTQPAILVKERQQDFLNMAEEYECSIHFISNFSVEDGIREFSEEMGVDLIAISNYEQHPIKRIFSGSTVEMLANHTNLPILSLGRTNEQQVSGTP